MAGKLDRAELQKLQRLAWCLGFGVKGLFRSISIRRISRNTVVVSLRKHIDVSISDKGSLGEGFRVGDGGSGCRVRSFL